jgi:monofunctional biosynthetic peptidoglycan transglycosylase
MTDPRPPVDPPTCAPTTVDPPAVDPPAVHEPAVDEPDGDPPGDLPGAPPPASAEPPRQKRWRRLLLALGGLLVAYLAWQLLTWPDVAALAQENPESTAFIDAWKRRAQRDGREPTPRWRWVSYGAISPQLKQAVVVAEDIDFFSHDGFATGELKTALADAWQERKVPRGASTITQQLAKNLWLTPSRNPLRKLKEALLTVQLEKHLDKRRILEIYLNVVELGDGIYGAEAAARHYYGASAAALSADQAAALAASLPRPKSWHPGVETRGYRRYVGTVRGRMRQAAWMLKEV